MRCFCRLIKFQRFSLSLVFCHPLRISLLFWNGSDNRSERSNNMVKLPVTRGDKNRRIEMAEEKNEGKYNTHRRAMAFRARSQCSINFFFLSMYLYLSKHKIII